MNNTERANVAMKKITIADLMSVEAYEAQRPAIRQAIMEHKKTRRVPLGPNSWTGGPKQA